MPNGPCRLAAVLLSCAALLAACRDGGGPSEPAGPPGTELVFSANATAGTAGTVGLNAELYVVNADGRGLTRLTNTATADELDPRWTADGRRITFASSSDALRRYVMNADGSGVEALPPVPSGVVPGAVPSPDGARLAFVRHRTSATSDDVYVVNVDGTGLQRVAEPPGLANSVSWNPASGTQ